MPTYIYLCKNEDPEHNHGEFEVNHSIKEKLEECPKCKEEGITSPVERLIASGSNFQLLGGGWFADSYQKK